ncbi:MAG: LytTR family DNA-binding domain-containing protein [Bacteroidales bacterium]|nr:LytTR family DNA-binding domain-containing protein [Bacteroidales bacterium]
MSDQIKTILIDDEPHCLSALQQLITKNCQSLNIIGTANSVKSGVEIIESKNPDLVFLDVRMPDGDGFNVLEKVHHNNFEVIFITAYEEYAIKAFEFSAIHYLLKPVEKSALIEAVERYNNVEKKQGSLDQRFDVLKESYNQSHSRIMLPSMEGFSIIEIEDIIRCEAEGCYTNIYVTNEDKPIVVSTPIGNYERLFSDLPFCRIHNKHLINMKHVTKYLKSYGGFVVMEDGTEVKVSERKRANLFEQMKSFARGA